MSILKTVRAGITGAALVAMAIASPVLAQEAKVLATVDSHQITDKDVAFTKQSLGEALQQVPADQQDQFIVNLLIESHVLADAARKEGLADTEEYKRQIVWLEAQALREAYVRKRTAELVKDADVKSRYDEAKAQVSGQKEIQASHILLKTEEEAKAVIADLDKGGDFAEIAKEKSTGPSGPRGGDLGFFGKGRMVPEFEKAAMALEKGTYTKEPVKTQFGFHVIKKVDERDQPFPEFKDVEERIRTSLQAEKLQVIVKELRDKAKVELIKP